MTRIQIQHDDGTIQETEALGWVSNGDGLCAVVRGADGVPKLEPVEGPDGARVVVSRPFRPVSSRHEVASPETMKDPGAGFFIDIDPSMSWEIDLSRQVSICGNGHERPVSDGIPTKCKRCPK